MTYNENLIKLRQRMTDALKEGVVGPEGKDFYEATMIQIMNEAERQRQICVQQADTLRRQAATADGQASAFSMISSIVYNVLNSFIIQAEKSRKEAETFNQERIKRTPVIENQEKTPSRKKTNK